MYPHELIFIADMHTLTGRTIIQWHICYFIIKNDWFDQEWLNLLWYKRVSGFLNYALNIPIIAILICPWIYHYFNQTKN